MKYIKLAILFLLFNSVLIAQNTEALTKALNKEYVKPMKKKDIIGMSLGIMDSGEVFHKQSFGFSDLENNIIASSDTEYKIGSISKLFTAIAVLQLQEQGLVNIEHSIRKYIPEIAIKTRFDEGNELIIRDILCHSSGLPSDILNGMFTETPKDFDWVLEKVNQQYMCTPGKTMMSYSNLGYGFLGELIKRVSGMTYVDYMKQNIFTPLGMESSYVFNGEESLSRAYNKGILYKPERVRDQAAGSVVSTVNDMLIFINMMSSGGKHEGNQFISKESIQLIEQNHLKGNSLSTSSQYGLGVSIHQVEMTKDGIKKDDTYIEHGGDTKAFHAHFGYVKDQSIGGVILTNSARGGAINSVHSLLDIYLKEKDGTEMTKIYAENKDLKNAKASDSEMVVKTGQYALASFRLDVENVKKIKLDLGSQKAILKQKKSSNAYKVRPILFGFIPIPLKNIEMVFFQQDGQTYISQNDLKSNRNEVIGVQVQAKEMLSSWKDYLGEYTFIDAIKTSFGVMDLAEDNCTLSIEGNFLKMTSNRENVVDNVFLQVHDDEMAYGIGIGRNTGNSLTKLANGNLSFMGYEMKKKE